VQDLLQTSKDSLHRADLSIFSHYLCAVVKMGYCFEISTYNGVLSVARMEFNFLHRNPYDAVLYICDQKSVDNPPKICLFMNCICITSRLSVSHFASLQQVG